MGLMARIAGQSLGMLRGGDLGKPFRFRGVGLMAACAQHGGVRQCRFQRGILRVLRERAVAGFAVHVGMLAGLLRFEDVRMTGFTGFMTGVQNGKGRDFTNRSCAIVTVLPEALWHKPGAKAQEQDRPQQEDPGDSQQMFRVSESMHGCP